MKGIPKQINFLSLFEDEALLFKSLRIINLSSHLKSISSAFLNKTLSIQSVSFLSMELIKGNNLFL